MFFSILDMDSIWTSVHEVCVIAGFVYICSMKRCGYILGVLLVLLLGGCHDKDSMSSGWYRTGHADVDAIMDSLFVKFGRNNGEIDSDALARLDSMACDTDAGVAVKARNAYWQTRALLRQRDKGEAAQVLYKALSYTDSAKYPGEFHRLMALTWHFESSLTQRYCRAMDNLRYFRHEGDSVHIAMTLMDLANIMYETGEYDRGRNMAEDVSRIWRELHMDDYADKSLLNVALMSQPPAVDSINRMLLTHTNLRNDTLFYELVLRNHFLNTDSVSYLEKAMQLSQQCDRLSDIRGAHHALHSDWLLRHGDPDLAMEAALSARDAMDSINDPVWEMLLNHALGMSYAHAGIADSAAARLKCYILLKDSIENGKKDMEIINAGRRAEIHRADVQRWASEQRHVHMMWTWVAIVSVIFCIVAFFLYRRGQRRHLHVMMAQAELRHVKSRIGREQILIKEKEQVIKSMHKEIMQSEQDGAISHGVSLRLQSVIKAHNSARDEREAFLEVHDDMLPGFSTRLKNAYPTLSEKQLRLAAYIAAGMSSAAIARVLNISTDSVVKNRYRLRKKIGVEAGCTLEDALRRFIEG